MFLNFIFKKTKPITKSTRNKEVVQTGCFAFVGTQTLQSFQNLSDNLSKKGKNI